MQRLKLLSGLLFVLSCTAAACSSTTASPSGGSSGSSSGSTPVSTADCSQRCQNKMGQCPSLAGQAQQACSQVCGAQLTEGQMSCLEGKACDELEKSSSINQICPASSGSSGGGKKAGEACACDTKSGFTQCSSTSGPCENGLICYGIDGDNVCGSSCKNGEPCAAGFVCTEQIYQGASIGKFCKKS